MLFHTGYAVVFVTQQRPNITATNCSSDRIQSHSIKIHLNNSLDRGLLVAKDPG
jgi:hypothetical protein